MATRSSTRSTLDEVDRRLLRLLTEDGRISVNELASRAHISRAAAYARFDRLRESGVITGFRATVDPEKVGVPLAALVLVNVDQAHWAQVREDLQALPGLEFLAFTSGSFDIVLLVRVPDIHALRDIVLVRLHSIPHVRTTHTNFVLDEQHIPLAIPDEETEPAAPRRRPRRAGPSPS
jgi:DNA-binding Lrp family transcriptional regulator